MLFDYSSLLVPQDGVTGTWREIYNPSLSYPENINQLLRQVILLPHDFYDLVTAYSLLPSALCRIIPYLFVFGQSGSGKSTVTKFIGHIHGVPLDTSGSTFAGIRNALDKRRQGWAELPVNDEEKRTYNKAVERNTILVWDDIDAGIFIKYPDLYRMFKFGYDRKTDKIIISSKEVGQNLEFHCFCPKVFSSISPLHLDDRFKELKRRLIVIPCKRVEELTIERSLELGITKGNWQLKLIDLDLYDWTGFNHEFEQFWDMETAQTFIQTRNILSKTVKGLGSQQRTISLDIMACGIATGIWKDEEVAVEKLKAYWRWFKDETQKNAGLGQLLKEYLKQEEKNSSLIGTNLTVTTNQIRNQIDIWVFEGWLFEKPNFKSVQDTMLDLGMRLQKGIWRRG